MAMKRGECLKVLAGYRTDALVLTAWQSSYPWQQLSPSEFNFPAVRTMGECSTFGLGLALARPDKRILVLEGDGSLCMNLGSLITIAMADPPNFYQFIMHNRIYESAGGQTIPNVDRLDFVAIARGAGISRVHRFGDTATFERELPALLEERGPVFTVLDIEPDETHLSGGTSETRSAPETRSSTSSSGRLWPLPRRSGPANARHPKASQQGGNTAPGTVRMLEPTAKT